MWNLCRVTDLTWTNINDIRAAVASKGVSAPGEEHDLVAPTTQREVPNQPCFSRSGENTLIAVSHHEMRCVAVCLYVDVKIRKAERVV